MYIQYFLEMSVIGKSERPSTSCRISSDKSPLSTLLERLEEGRTISSATTQDRFARFTK
jgi:hypothetical protein